MKITKNLLQLIAQSLELSPVGTIKNLKLRICERLCNVHDDLDEMKKLVDEGLNIDEIKKRFPKIPKKHITIFAEIMDAYKKKDYTYIEQKIEYSDAKGGIKLVRDYAEKHKQEDLLSLL